MSECRITDYKNTASLTSKIIHVGQDELHAAGGARFDTDAFCLKTKIHPPYLLSQIRQKPLQK